MRPSLRFALKAFLAVAAGVLIPPLLYLLTLAARAFLADQFVIPTCSMSPTLIPGDRVWVVKPIIGPRLYTDFSFDSNGGELRSMRLRGLRPVRLNDIVVFNFPHHDGRISFVINNVYCKRVLALPGDTISIRGGRYANSNSDAVLGLRSAQSLLASTPDSAIGEWRMRAMPYDGSAFWTMREFGPMYVPRKGDVIRVTPKEASLYGMLLEWETGSKLTTDNESGKVYADGKELRRHRFTHDYYFMGGDNVIDSNDSRYWGLVPEEYIVGVVKLIWKSIDPDTGESRKERRFVRL